MIKFMFLHLSVEFIKTPVLLISQNMATNVILHLETEIRRLKEKFGNLEKDLVQALEEKHRLSQENNYLRQELRMSTNLNEQMLKGNRTLNQEKSFNGRQNRTFRA